MNDPAQEYLDLLDRAAPFLAAARRPAPPEQPGPTPAEAIAAEARLRVRAEEFEPRPDPLVDLDDTQLRVRAAEFLPQPEPPPAEMSTTEAILTDAELYIDADRFMGGLPELRYNPHHGKGGRFASGGGGGWGANAVTGDVARRSVAFSSAGMSNAAQVDRAISDYGGEGPNSYQTINDGLRGGGTFGTTSFTAQQQANVDGLDAAMARAKGSPRMLVHRQVGDPVALFGGNRGDYRGVIRMRILVPPGTKAISHSGLDPDEILIDRGLTYKVVATRGGGKDLTGLTWLDKGFVSTAVDPGEIFSGDHFIDVEVVP